jgi:hypothetical protein
MVEKYEDICPIKVEASVMHIIVTKVDTTCPVSCPVTISTRFFETSALTKVSAVPDSPSKT